MFYVCLNGHLFIQSKKILPCQVPPYIEVGHGLVSSWPDSMASWQFSNGFFRADLNEVVEHHKEKKDNAKEVGKHGQLYVADHFDLVGQIWKINNLLKENGQYKTFNEISCSCHASQDDGNTAHHFEQTTNTHVSQCSCSFQFEA